MQKKTKVLVSFIVPSLLCLTLGVGFLIPDKINMMVGKEEKISFNLPFKAVLKAEEKIIVSGMETQPVTENIEIDLSKNSIITPLNAGKTEAEISAFGIHLKTVSVNIMPQKTVIPCGKVVGIVMKTEGILVLGTGSVKDEGTSISKPSEGLLRTGDVIVNCNSTQVNEKEDLQSAIEKSNGNAINLTVIRNNAKSIVNITPKKNESGEYKIGVWIRDSTQGLGTLTFLDTATHTYGALGHGVYDVDTKTLTPIAEGMLTKAEIWGIQKGEAGSPGEISGKLAKSQQIGEISQNTSSGIFGTVNVNDEAAFGSEAVEIGFLQDVHAGEAIIKSDVLGQEVKEYTIEIESINKLSKGTDKGMVIRVTDERLLSATGGIIQGMSGSPILQDGKLIGAVTHVFVKDSAKGYGIFIENMLEKTR